MRIKFGVQFWQEEFDIVHLKNAVKEVEDMGFESAWIYDHFYPMSKATSYNMLEAWTLLPFLAAATEKIRLGVLVTCNSYRHPSILAKIASSVDIISNGRLEFGIGAGWFEEEYDAYGIPFPKAKIRLDQMDEAIVLIKKIWMNEKINFRGKYYTAKDLISLPKPIQKPYPPIMIGGKGDNLLRIAAQHADNVNLVNCTPEEYGKKLEVLKNYCEKNDRDYNCIIKSWHGLIVFTEKEKARKMILKYKENSRIKSVQEKSLEELMNRAIVGTPEDCVDKIQDYINSGVEYFIPHFAFSDDLESEQIFIDEISSCF
jgi:F420-dependent oxidoreductase-like protein